MRIGLPASSDAAKGEAPVVTTHEFCLFVDGADLTVASTVERLECIGYTHRAAAASSGVQALVFSRSAEHLAEAVEAAAAEADRIPGVCIARDVRSDSVAAFDPATLEPMIPDINSASTEPSFTASTRHSPNMRHARRLSSPVPLS